MMLSSQMYFKINYKCQKWNHKTCNNTSAQAGYVKEEELCKRSKLSSWLRLPNLPYCVPIEICEWLK